MGTEFADTNIAGPDETQAMVAELHRTHYVSLVRLAGRLLDERTLAEEVVQDAFLAVHDGRARPRSGKEAPYLRSMVMNGARSRLRRRQLHDRLPHEAPRTACPAEDAALLHCERERLLAAVRMLPARQRQVLTLRYFDDLSEAQIAAALGISAGSVKTHASRGLRTLATTLIEAA